MFVVSRKCYKFSPIFLVLEKIPPSGQTLALTSVYIVLIFNTQIPIHGMFAKGLHCYLPMDMLDEHILWYMTVILV